MLFSICHAQNFGFNTLGYENVREKDTVRVIILVCDTNSVKQTYIGNGNDKSIWTKGYTYWLFAYSVREKYNTGEDLIDKGFYKCIDQYGREVECFTDYWKHVEYLGPNKKPLSSSIIVWKHIDTKQNDTKRTEEDSL